MVTLVTNNGILHAQINEEKREHSDFMAEPLTPKAMLEEGKEDMKVKMELFIMKIQV